MDSVHRDSGMVQWLLYEHEDGRYAAAPSAEAATFAVADPKWHRVGPIGVPLHALDQYIEPRVIPGGDVLMPVDAKRAAEMNAEKILQSEELGSEFARCSSTEAVMVALALCDRRYLPAGLSTAPGRDLWSRLDNRQRAAIALFGQSAG